MIRPGGRLVPVTLAVPSLKGSNRPLYALVRFSVSGSTPPFTTASANEDGKMPFRISATLFYAVMIMIVGQAFLFTILPPIGRQVGMADYQIGLVMSVHGLFMLFTGPMWGAASETWGRRRVIVIGGSVFAVSVVMFGLIVDAAISGLVSGMAVLSCRRITSPTCISEK